MWPPPAAAAAAAAAALISQLPARVVAHAAEQRERLRGGLKKDVRNQNAYKRGAEAFRGRLALVNGVWTTLGVPRRYQYAEERQMIARRQQQQRQRQRQQRVHRSGGADEGRAQSTT